MILSKNDHINVGIGHIYGAPFMGRVFLYRLFECDCAVLIYHLQDEEVSDVRTFGNVKAVAARGGCEPGELWVHISLTSASMDLEDLLALPATRITLQEDGFTIKSFGDVVIRIERFMLQFTEKLILAYAWFPQHKLTISGSAYYVIGCMDVSLLPEASQWKNQQRRCWKLSLYNIKHNRGYNLDSNSDWSLNVLDTGMQKGFKATHYVTLCKNVATK